LERAVCDHAGGSGGGEEESGEEGSELHFGR
jgi:hypothetical protein